MAVFQTMSNPTNNNNWMIHSYQPNFSNTTTNQPETPPPTTDTTTVSASDSRNNNLIPDQGRISKPHKRRSRVSRRTPTTLLNTDPSNFRAMVQHFTGGPSVQQQFAARPQFPSGGPTNFNFTHPYAGMNADGIPGGFQVQYANQQAQMFMMSSGGGGVSSHAPPGNSSDSENRNFDNYML